MLWLLVGAVVLFLYLYQWYRIYRDCDGLPGIRPLPVFGMAFWRLLDGLRRNALHKEHLRDIEVHGPFSLAWIFYDVCV